MAKPLTQKRLKAMQKKAQERLNAQRKQLASLEQTYAELTGKLLKSDLLLTKPRVQVNSSRCRRWRYWRCSDSISYACAGS
jgi:hypothetical protein